MNHGYHFINGQQADISSRTLRLGGLPPNESVRCKLAPQFEIRGKKRLSYHYRFANRIPLRATQPALEVNWCEVTVTDTSDQTTLYHNAFATCHEIHDQNVAEIVTAGRARTEGRE